MVLLGGGMFLMREVPLCRGISKTTIQTALRELPGFYA